MRIRKIFSLSVFAFIFSSILQSGALAESQDLCNGPFHQEEVCSRMKHLRSTINAMDAQRELTQVNYEYMQVLSIDLKNNSSKILQLMTDENKSHKDGIKQVQKLASEVAAFASERNPDTFVQSNLLRNTCVSCHSSAAPPSGIKWSDVFTYDWEKTSQACNNPGKNPYQCRSMNGMLTAYSQVLTSYVAGIKDYELTAGAASEILRIIRALGKNNFLHFSEGLRLEVETNAVEIETLARLKDPLVFEKSQALPQTCMQCHQQSHFSF